MQSKMITGSHHWGESSKGVPMIAVLTYRLKDENRGRK